MVVGGEILEANIIAADGLDQGGMAQRILGRGPAAQRGVADDLAGSDDADVVGVDRIDEAGAALDPLAFPANLRDGIVGEVGSAEDGGVLVEAQNGVRLEGDGAGEIVAGGNEHFAAAQHPAAVDRLLNGGGVFGRAVASGAEVADVESDLGRR